MEPNEILNQLEEIIKNDALKEKVNKKKSEIQSTENSSKDIVYLVLHFIINLLKTPLHIVTKYFNKKMLRALMKDAKIISFLLVLMVVMFVFFAVVWLSISVWVGVYFYEQGVSTSSAVAYSIFFQIGSIILVALIAFFATKRIKSLKLAKKIKSKQKELSN